MFPNANSECNSGWWHISQQLDGACVEARQRVMLVKAVAHSPAEARRNNLCRAVGRQENAGGSGMLCSVLGWLMLWISLCSLGCPCSGLWLRHTSLPWPLVEPGPWLAHWLAHRGGNQVQAFYKPIINIFDTYNLWNLANQDLIWFISCFLPFI